MSRSGIVFPYGITLSDGGALSVFPAAEVALFSHTGERLSLFLLIDSGATISALPASDAVVLGLNLKNGVPMAVGGIHGNVIMGLRHEVTIEIGGEALHIPFVFLPHDDAPRVLGRAGVFDRYTIVFDEQKRRTAFVDTSDASAKRIDDALTSLSP